MLKKLTDEDIVTLESNVTESFVLPRRFFSGNVSISTPITWHSGNVSGSIFHVAYDNSDENYRNKLYSITYGYTTSSLMFSGSFIGSNGNEKLKIYKLYAQKLLGNRDSVFFFDGNPRHELIFVNLYRNLYKDEIRNISFAVSPTGTFSSNPVIGVAKNTREFQSFAGRAFALAGNNTGEVGLLFGQAGVVVLDATKIGTSSAGGNFWSGTMSYENLAKGVSGSTYDDLLFACRSRIVFISASNVSRVKTSVYRCEALTHEYNYSSNPTFLNEEGMIISMSGSSENLSPTTYITTVSLFGENGAVLAVGKLSKPTKKNQKNRVVVNVRLDY